SLSDGFALFAADGRMMFCNGVYRKINENQPWVTDGPVTLEYIIKCNMELGLLEDAIGREEEFLAERMAHHREPRDGARLTRRTDGNVILIQEKKLADGCIALVNTDLTELSRREIALTEALAATERASRAKSDFLAQMSHEFRTPLNAIIGFSDLVLSETFGPVGSERYRTYIGDVKSSGEHLLSLINDLLDLTGIESGRREYDFEGLQPREIVSGALRAVRPIGQHAKIRLRGSTSRDLPSVKVDARSMHQCLLNLLSNAIRATRQGSRAILRSERHAPGLVAFSVTDTGCGISAGHVQHLLTGSGAKGDGYIADSGGTGLGLPITKSLIGVMGGRLDIESNIGEGTKVTLILPEA
ncbi:MAG: ATP-binding protein, partial [Alphaproteobacteria bacterium]|nr:ATP-binding protein [Alphaproteobacteria bacterium]